MSPTTYEPDHGEKEVDAVISGPITNDLAYRLAVRHREMDGYMKNIHTGDDVAEREEDSLRLSLRWDVSDDLDVNLKLERGEYEIVGRNIQVLASGGVGFLGADATFDEKNALNDDFHEDELENYVLTVNYQLGENTLTSITGYSAYEYSELVDGDLSTVELFDIYSDEEFDQFSQELRLISSADRAVEYIAGLYFQTSELEYSDTFDLQGAFAAFPAPFSFLANRQNNRNFSTDADTWAAFAQATWNISDAARLIIGGRYTREEKEGSRTVTPLAPDGSVDTAVLPLFGINAHSVHGDRKEISFTPLVTAQWDISDDTMLYASATTGFKSGGFGARSNNPALFEFEDEEAKSLEIGAKTGFWDGRGELNAALFMTKYEQLQVSSFDGVLGFNVGNAEDAEVMGIELDGRVKLSEALEMNYAVSWLDFQFKDYLGPCYKGQTATGVDSFGSPACDYDGKENNFSPDLSASLGLRYEQSIGKDLLFNASLDVNYVAEHYTAPDLDPLSQQGAETKVNMRIALADQSDTWELALLGRNLTDELTQNFANDVPLTGAARTMFAMTERPRSIALQGTYRF